MKNSLRLLAVICYLSMFSTVQANLVYDLSDYPMLQEGHTVFGTITTLTTAPEDGLLTSGEIVDWQVTVEGPEGFTASKGPSTPSEIYGNIGITLDSISISFPLNDGDVNEFALKEGFFKGIRYLTVFDSLGAGFFETYDAQPAMSEQSFWANIPLHEANPWIIATASAASPTPVPEPSSIAIWGFAMGLLGLAAWKRRQRG